MERGGEGGASHRLALPQAPEQRGVACQGAMPADALPDSSSFLGISDCGPKHLPHTLGRVHFPRAYFVAGPLAVRAVVPVVGDHGRYSLIVAGPSQELLGVLRHEVVHAVSIALGVAFGSKRPRHQDSRLVGQQPGVQVAVVEPPGLVDMLRVWGEVVAVQGNPRHRSREAERGQAPNKLRHAALQRRPGLVDPDDDFWKVGSDYSGRG
mmetsp:Transcript_8222/g.23617  ORF Transcript_8222/g.23617 Transcript_8222/m.23617 type:complete len:209 (+) Transcript_8222:610-1236(+)